MTKEQIQKMKHCLGIIWSASRKETEPGKRYRPKVTSYRNFYHINQDDDWDGLVDKGFAVKDTSSPNLSYYYVTEEGKNELKSIGYIFK